MHILKSIPAGARQQVATCLSSLMRDVVLHPLNEGAYVRLFLFPRAVLRTLPPQELMKLRRKRRWHAQRVFTLRCLNDWLAGGEKRDDLIRVVLALPVSHPRDANLASSNLRRCERIAREDGQFRKAIKALGSQGIAPLTADTLQALRDLHPEGPAVASTPVYPDGIEVDADLVSDMLQSFPKGSASGRSGMKVTHLVECCSHQAGVPSFLEQLTALVNLFLTGKALPSFASFMASASLVPLLKKDGRSVRPIAVGEVLRRLISKCCVKRFSHAAASYLQPMQVGVRVRNGAEALLHTFNRFIRDPDKCGPDTVMALVDFSNAFNRVDRNSMLREVLERFPGMYGWVQYCYGVGARLFVGLESMVASAGCQQGDPLGPLLFAVVLHPLLVQLRDRFSLTVGAYLDDLTVAGPTQRVSEAIRWLRAEGPRHGLHLSASKTVVWSPFPRDLRESGLFDDDLCHSTEEGVELLGGAVSTSATFYASVIAKRIDKCIASMHRMMQLDDPQLCLMLLRSCEGMPKLVYSWRTIPPEYLADAASRFEQEVLSALRWIVSGDGPHFGAFNRRLATLPVSMGGLGVTLPSDVLHFAYCASALSSFEMQQELLGFPTPASDRDLPVDVSARLDSAVLTIAGAAGAPALRQEVLEVAFPDASNTAAVPLRNTQLFMARAYFEAQRATLLDHPYVTSKDEPTKRRFKAILDSNCRFGTSAWLFALPNGGMGQRMTPLEFQAAVRLRLLMPQFTPGSRCCQRTCEATMDVYGYHALVCRGHMLSRHNSVRDALFELMWKARFDPVKDAAVTCLGMQAGRPAAFRPADLLVAGDDFDRDCVDVTVVSPLTTNNQREVEVGKAAQVAEDKKIRKHRAACEAAGYGFKAFALDVFGVMGRESSGLLRRVCRKMVRETCCAEYKAAAICYRRISMSVQLGVARQLIACREVCE